ncbi:ATP-binding protein [Sporosarcina sp. NPDC096371]|uniref:ATP-binding protein n=1 Tax=Sporosarcina sp. NPDC096371 TaxID=3364530 RepID=UPI0038019FA5
MMNQETSRKLTEMKMGAMAELYQQQGQNKDYRAMDFDDRFNLLVDYGYDCRKSNGGH